ncbi:MAG: hypothetical protein KTR31_26635 [Myxococcales bacterium]|nr:hypothetical protein [Myxococcales bacterium]
MTESQLSSRLDAIELKLDMILEALGVTGPARTDRSAEEEETRDAKEAVERL